MVFSSTIFLLYFLPLFLAIYSLTPARFKNQVILLFSIGFYAWGAPKFVFLLLGSTIVDFYIVQYLHHSKNAKHRRYFLASSIVLNVGLLVYFKYANFLVENINTIASNSFAWEKVALPIGISFYTFQTLTYSIDVYRKVHAPFQKLSNYLLYILSFPQMIAGPIVRFSSIADDIIARQEKCEDKIRGFVQFSIGLGKKVLIANVMAEQADLILNSDISSTPSLIIWTGVIAYAFQIYFDFAGYSDMAIGLGRMMGLGFPENFNSPYIAKNISEFWRRWHITLGTWMRDYLYIPLGGNKKGKIKMYLNLWLVFLISGLWHGASWNFVIWGAYHGLFLMLDKWFLIRLLTKIGAWPSRIFTFVVVIFGWVLFRMETFDGALQVFEKMFSWHWTKTPFTLPPLFMGTLALAIFFSVFSAFKAGQKVEKYVYEANYLQANGKTAAFVLVSLVCFLISTSFITASNFNPFIYFRF